MTKRTPVAADSAPHVELPPVLDFTPVARKYRHDGWTPERQRAFILALAETGSVTRAAQRVGKTTEGAYQLRLAPGSESLCHAWAAALELGIRSLADLAIDRARDGTPVPIMHKGEQVGERRWYDNRLLMFILRHHLPDQYGLQLNGGTRSKATIEREAAENCPTCRAARERGVEEESEEARIAFLDDILKRYQLKLRQEREERAAGRWYAADFYLRQLTHIELVLDTAGRSGDLLDQFTTNPDRYGGTLYASPLSRIIADRRAAVWAAMDASPRPPLRLPRTMTESSMSGANADARYSIRAACEKRIAQAQDEWEATRTEESWAAWVAGRAG